MKNKILFLKSFLSVNFLLLILCSYNVYADNELLLANPESHYTTNEDERLCVIPFGNANLKNCDNEHQTNDNVSYLINDSIPNIVDTVVVITKFVEHGQIIIYNLDESANTIDPNLSESGYFTYNPNSNFTGTDTFQYKLIDNTDPQNPVESEITTVTINIGGSNEPPEAQELNFPDASLGDSLIYEDTMINRQLIGTDPFVGDVLILKIKTSPTNGVLSNINNSTGEFTYTPNKNFFGKDTFSFTVTDSFGEEGNESNVNIELTSTNDAPTISLVGSTTTSLVLGEVFVDQGATSEDVEDGDLTSAITTSGKVDINTVGIYEIIYTAVDSENLSGYATRTVTVLASIPVVEKSKLSKVFL